LLLRAPIYLYIQADDGAQLWQDGRRIPLDENGMALLQAKPDSSTLCIRVLNNAVKGGLTNVNFKEVAQWDGFVRYKRAGDSIALLQMAELPPLAVAGLKPGSPTPISRPSTGKRMSFTAWGDSQGGWDTFAFITNQILLHTDDAFTIGLGDLTANGRDPVQWLGFQQALAPVLEQRPAFLIAGNHDYDNYYEDLMPRQYLKHAHGATGGPTYFAWQQEAACFIALDPNGQFPLGFNDTQQQWLMQQLQSDAWRQARWRFLLVHQPPYGQGWAGYAGDNFARELVDSLAENYHVDFVLSGHIHDYERLSRRYGRQKTHFLVLGGAGGGLEPAESNPVPVMDRVIKRHHYAHFRMGKRTVLLTIRDTQGKVLDKKRFRK
jgi:predicted phosphodiesterase